jgi:LysR family glycine cleavage system transcriptional activator
MDLAGISGREHTHTILFSEESHAIQAALDGAGAALVSSLLVAGHLRSGDLLQIHPLSLPGFPYRAIYLQDHPRAELLRRIVAWLSTLADDPVQT